MNCIIDDAFLYSHMENAENLMMTAIPNEMVLNHQYSKRFLHKMKDLLKYERRTPVMRSFVHYSKTTAAVFLIFINIAFTTTMSVEAYRIRFFEFATTVWEELTSIVICSEYNSSHDVLTPIEPAYIPKGYTVIEQENTIYQNTIIYANGDENEIYYVQELATQSEFIIDSENADAETIKIENTELYLLQRKGTTQLYWHDTFYVYSLIGAIESAELTMMAESILKN